MSARLGFGPLVRVSLDHLVSTGSTSRRENPARAIPHPTRIPPVLILWGPESLSGKSHGYLRQIRMRTHKGEGGVTVYTEKQSKAAPFILFLPFPDPVFFLLFFFLSPVSPLLLMLDT